MQTATIFLLLVTSGIYAKVLAQDIRVDIHGRDVIVKKGKEKARAYNENTRVGTQSIVKTDSQSIAKLTLPSNGKIILSPLSKLLIRSRTQQGRYLISLLKGDIFFQTKKGSPWDKRPAGAVINVRHYPTAYFGRAYRLKFLPRLKKGNFIEVKQSPVKMLKLSSLNDE